MMVKTVPSMDVINISYEGACSSGPGIVGEMLVKTVDIFTWFLTPSGSSDSMFKKLHFIPLVHFSIC